MPELLVDVEGVKVIIDDPYYGVKMMKNMTQD